MRITLNIKDIQDIIIIRSSLTRLPYIYRFKKRWSVVEGVQATVYFTSRKA